MSGNNFGTVSSKLIKVDQAWQLENSTNDLIFKSLTNSNIIPITVQATAPANSLYINSLGKIGFGTNNPINYLHIEANATSGNRRFIYLKNTNTGTTNISYIDLVSGASTSVMTVAKYGSEYSDSIFSDFGCLESASNGIIMSANGASGILKFLTGASNTERMRVSSAGNVGIGTTPLVKLDILSGSANTTGDNLTSPTTTITGPNVAIGGVGINSSMLMINSNTGQGADIGGSLGFGGRYSTDASEAHFATIKGAKENSTSGAYGSYLTFATRSNGSTLTERIRISSSGRVGLGFSPHITAPSATLDVGGGVEGDVKVFNVYQNVNNGGSSTMVLFGDDRGYSGAHTGRTLDIYQNVITSNTGTLLNIRTSSLDPVFRVHANGNVGIGDVAPSTRKLYVNGTAKFNTWIDLQNAVNKNFGVGGFYSADECDILFSSDSFSTHNSCARFNKGGYAAIGNNSSPDTGVPLKVQGPGTATYGALNVIGAAAPSSGNFYFTIREWTNTANYFYVKDNGETYVGGRLGVGGVAPTNGVVHIASFVSHTPATYSGAGANAAWTTGQTAAINIAAYGAYSAVFNGVYSYSDKRMKKDIIDISTQEALDFIKLVDPVKFKWKNTGEDDYGFIAQDILKAGFPKLVSALPEENLAETNEDGIISPENKKLVVKYEATIPLLVKAIRELLDKNEKLEERVMWMEKLILKNH